MNTYDLNAVTRRGSDVPGALFTAGILVGPVRAAQGPTGAVDLMLTLSWTHARTQKHTSTHMKRKLKIVAAQEKVKGNGKRTGRREMREPN